MDKSVSVRTLYYSNYCVFCKELLAAIQKSPIQSEIKLVCIEQVPPPPFINNVPSLIIENQQLLVGEQVFQWLEQISQKMSQSGEPVPWHCAEMGSSFSDNYSFISEGSEKKAMHHSYSYLNDNPESLPSFTKSGDVAQSGGGNSMRSEKSASLDKAYEQLMQQRNSEQASNVANMRV